MGGAQNDRSFEINLFVPEFGVRVCGKRADEGGPCDFLARPYDEGQIASLIRFCAEGGIRWQVIGNGSNLLAPDVGIPGVVIQVGQNFSYIRLSARPGEILCAAGASLNAVAAFAQKQGLSGLEFAWGIPGNVGGAVCMNAGAYGGEM